MKQSARRRAGHYLALRNQFIGERRIDTGDHKDRVSAWQLLSQPALDDIQADCDIGNAALSDELLELAERNAIDPVRLRPGFYVSLVRAHSPPAWRNPLALRFHR